MLNHGMFTGTAGWVLKPDGYRSAEPTSDLIHRRTLTLELEVFAAQDLSLPPGEHKEKGFKPYVNCQLHVEESDGPVAAGRDDASSDSEKSSFRRCTKSSSGINPDFKGQKLVFPTVTSVVEELSFVRFVSLFFSFLFFGLVGLPRSLFSLIFQTSFQLFFPSLRGSPLIHCLHPYATRGGCLYHADFSLQYFAFSSAHQKPPRQPFIPTV